MFLFYLGLFFFCFQVLKKKKILSFIKEETKKRVKFKKKYLKKNIFEREREKERDRERQTDIKKVV